MPDPHEKRSEALHTTLIHAQAAQQGSAAAWEKLDARIRPWLIEVLASQPVPPGMTAEDLVQITLLEVYSDFDRFIVEPGASLRGWVVSIARMRLQDAWRRAKSDKRGGRVAVKSLDPSQTDGAALQLPDRRGGSPTSGLYRSELRERLFRALEQMNTKQRLVLELRLLEDLPFKDIAARSGFKTEEAVRTFFFRTKQELQRRLGSPE